MTKTTYFGITTWKSPIDYWVYQEIIFQHKPDVILEIGNAFGGSALALAHLCDNIGHGKIIGLDISHKNISPLSKAHNRITFIEGDACSSLDKVKNLIKPEDKVLVIEDSSHTYENTLNVLRTYSSFIKSGDYFIVEDSICHHGLDVGPNPGPYEAINDFLKENKNFVCDRDKESFFITWNPKGFLKRIS
jgi:cephalosporin hydroxylase